MGWDHLGTSRACHILTYVQIISKCAFLEEPKPKSNKFLFWCHYTTFFVWWHKRTSFRLVVRRRQWSSLLINLLRITDSTHQNQLPNNPGDFHPAPLKTLDIALSGETISILAGLATFRTRTWTLLSYVCTMEELRPKVK